MLIEMSKQQEQNWREWLINHFEQDDCNWRDAIITRQKYGWLPIINGFGTLEHWETEQEIAKYHFQTSKTPCLANYYELLLPMALDLDMFPYKYNDKTYFVMSRGNLELISQYHPNVGYDITEVDLLAQSSHIGEALLIAISNHFYKKYEESESNVKESV